MKTKLQFIVIAFLLPLFATAQVNRVGLMEEFTGASCPPCAAQNPAFNTLLDGAADKVIGLKIQMNIPGADAMYSQNSDENDQYWASQTADGVPTAFLNGIAGDDDYADGVGAWDIAGGGYAGGPYGYNQAVIDYAYDQLTPITLELSHAWNNDFSAATVSYKIKNVTDTDFTMTDGKLKIAIIEEEISFAASNAPGTNGELEFSNIMRKMLPDFDGIAISTIAAGDSIVGMVEAPMPNYIYNLGQVGFVGFVQDWSTKEVFQAGQSAAGNIPGNHPDIAAVNTTAAPTELCGASITPTLQFSNDGTIDITSFDASYSINGGTPVLFNWEGTLEPDSTVEVVFDEVVLPGGTSTVSFDVSNINEGQTDLNNINNTISNVTYSAISTTSVGTTIQEDCENADLEYLSSTVVQAPIPAGGFGWGSFTTVSQNAFSDATSPIGGYGSSDFSIWLNFYQWNSSLSGVDPEGYMIFDKIDLSGANNVMLSYDRSGGRYSGSNDRLQILASTDCGNTWTIIHDIQGADLSTVDGHTEALFVPTADTWETDMVVIPSEFLVDGVNFMFKAISDWGNATYLDNINLVIATDVINLTALENNTIVYPNPASSRVNIEFALENKTNIDVTVYDLEGKVVSHLVNATQYSEGQHSITWEVDNVSSGIYVAKISTDNGVISKRISIL